MSKISMKNRKDEFQKERKKENRTKEIKKMGKMTKYMTVTKRQR